MGKISNTTRYARYKFYSQNAIYHIYNRGNGKQDIFLNQDDYLFYLNRLKRYLEKHQVSLVCYVLMPNHIHLVVKQGTDKPIHKFISSLHTSYSKYLNKKYDRVGHLFQDRFKQVIIETDEQLLYLTKYIHLNPVQAGLIAHPGKYTWSSFNEYMHINNPTNLCDKTLISGLLTSKQDKFTKTYAEFCEVPLKDTDEAMLEELVIEPF